MLDDVEQTFDQRLSMENLRTVYAEEIAGRGGTGMDGLSPSRFDEQKETELRTIQRKCRDGSYTFTPYREVLKSRGRKRKPRVISIPTVRDRIVLYLLKDLLHDIFDDCVNRSLPNQVVRRLKKYYLESNLDEKVVYIADIKSFYDDINHDHLERKIRSRINPEKIIKLIFRSLKTPTVPRNYRRENKDNYIPQCGVPQGLAISNILAEICLEGFDQKISSEVDFYERYVDDILLFCDADDVSEKYTLIGKNLTERGDLSLNEDKSKPIDVEDGFQYLGYRFDGDNISVKQKSVDEFIDSIASLFTYLRENIEIEIKERYGVDRERLKSIFVEKINEKLTGVVSKDNRYGWVFYFMEINDEALLHQIDSIVEDFFKRSPLFDEVPSNLKSIARAYWEVKSRPRGGYVQNYDQFETPKEKYGYLRDHGVVNPDEEYTVDEIELLFAKERDRTISRLKADAGTMS